MNRTNYQAVIFDLDGTLVNSLEDIADAMNRTLLKFDYPIHSYDAYKYFVGRGIKHLVYQCLPPEHQTEEDVSVCLKIMMEEYGKTYATKTKLYDGIAGLLDFLIEKGLKLTILSNKADELTHKIYNRLLSSWSFDMVLGATDRFPQKPDPGVALHMARTIGVSPENILYLGDTGIDMQTAKSAGMFPVGVTWGFRLRAELEEKGAQLIINKPEDLLNFFK